MPKNSPRSTENPTSRTASNSSKVRRRNGCSARSLSVCICSCGRWKRLCTPSATIAGAVIPAILAGLRARHDDLGVAPDVEDLLQIDGHEVSSLGKGAERPASRLEVAEDRRE